MCWDIVVFDISSYLGISVSCLHVDVHALVCVCAYMCVNVCGCTCVCVCEHACASVSALCI